MAVENYFLSREGRILSTKILKFMRSLVIKINTEANEEETKESYLNWTKYKYAYEGTDDLFAYEYTMEDCIRFGISSENVKNKNLLDKMAAYKLQLKEDTDAMTLLKKLRKERIESYVETNSYYSQFQGIPRKGQEIKIANKDRTSLLDPEYLYIQDINIDRYPQTYEYVFLTGLIEKIKEDNPSYYYLRFLEEKKSIYLVRNTEQFDILWCDEILLNDTELNNFYRIYKEKKVYMQELMYVKGFDSRMDMYPFLMEILLLQDVFMSFFNSYMDNFALANYSDQEIFDILDSYNLSSLKKVKMTTLRKIIREIPDLMELRGSDLIIEKLLDIVADNSVTIKRYYLTKIYKTASDGQTKFDTTKTYEDNIDVVFKEKIIRKGNNTTEEGTNDYLSFTEDDDTWGGDLEGLSSEQKAKIKSQFKRELMQMDFSNILTKYLTISSTVNSYDKQVRTQNLLGLLWQWLRKNKETNFMIDDTVSFSSYDIRPIDMYAAICWLNQYVNGIPEPEKINIKNMNIANVLILRDTGVESLVNSISGKNNEGKSETVTLPAGLGDRTILDVLGQHSEDGENSNPEDSEWPYFIDSDGEYKINYKNVFIHFDPNLTISELFAKYDENVAILDALKERWIKSSTLAEAKCWDYLIEQNRTNTLFEIMFDPPETRFDLLIRNSNREFFNYINLSMNTGDFEIIYALLIRLLEAFRTYMLDATENIISLKTPNADEDESSVDYLSDLKLLFNEFLSVYTELHKIEFSQVIDDSPYNRIKILYHYDKDILYNSFTDNYIRIGTLNKTTKKYLPNSNKFRDDKRPGYGEIVKDETFYSFVFEMMKDNKIKSRKTQVSELENKLDNIDNLYNKTMSKIEVLNLISFTNDELDKLNYIRTNSIGGLSNSLQNKYDVCTEIISTLNDPDGFYFYKDVMNIVRGDTSGALILSDYIYSEINALKEIIEELNKRTDILPHYRHYVQMELFEAFSDKIITVYGVESLGLNFDKPKMLYHNIDMLAEDSFNDKLRLELEYLEDLLENSYNLKMVTLKDTIEESDLGITLFIKDYMTAMKYIMIEDEIINEGSSIVHLEEKIINELIECIKKDKLNLKHSILELEV